MIVAEKVNKQFGSKHVLQNIDATFNKGQANLIIGKSGSGKTVLMKCLVGLLHPTTGNVLFDNRNFTTMSDKEKKDIRKEIGMVFQGGALFDSMNVEENIKLPLKMFSKYKNDEMESIANTCLKRVNLENANKMLPSELSGGMKKRVAIARAIAFNPKYLFFDEPNSGLDPQTSIVIDNLIYEITKEYNTTTVINTHDMNSVLAIGDNIIFLYDGQKFWEGGKDSIMDAEQKEVHDFVFASQLLKKLKK